MVNPVADIEDDRCLLGDTPFFFKCSTRVAIISYLFMYLYLVFNDEK